MDNLEIFYIENKTSCMYSLYFNDVFFFLKENKKTTFQNLETLKSSFFNSSFFNYFYIFSFFKDDFKSQFLNKATELNSENLESLGLIAQEFFNNQSTLKPDITWNSNKFFINNSFYVNKSLFFFKKKSEQLISIGFLNSVSPEMCLIYFNLGILFFFLFRLIEKNKNSNKKVILEANFPIQKDDYVLLCKNFPDYGLKLGTLGKVDEVFSIFKGLVNFSEPVFSPYSDSQLKEIALNIEAEALVFFLDLEKDIANKNFFQKE